MLYCRSWIKCMFFDIIVCDPASGVEMASITQEDALMFCPRRADPPHVFGPVYRSTRFRVSSMSSLWSELVFARKLKPANSASYLRFDYQYLLVAEARQLLPRYYNPTMWGHPRRRTGRQTTTNIFFSAVQVFFITNPLWCRRTCHNDGVEDGDDSCRQCVCA